MTRAKSQSDVTVMKVTPDSSAYFVPPDGVTFGMDLKFSPNSSSNSIPPRMTFTIDCGFECDIPTHAVVNVVATDDWSKKGLLLTPSEQRSGRFTVVAHNVGKQILSFVPEQVIGKLSFSEKKPIGFMVT